jgi:hypothetical protein
MNYISAYHIRHLKSEHTILVRRIKRKNKNWKMYVKQKLNIRTMI